MTDTESKQLLLEIINKAQDNQAVEFRVICCWEEFRYYSRLIKSTAIIVKTLEASAKHLFKEYCSDVIAGTSNINKLLAYSHLNDIITFYRKDVDTLKQMLDEYDDYLGNGNFIYSFLGGRRDI